jgi:hypothetical protein
MAQLEFTFSIHSAEFSCFADHVVKLVNCYACNSMLYLIVHFHSFDSQCFFASYELFSFGLSVMEWLLWSVFVGSSWFRRSSVKDVSLVRVCTKREAMYFDGHNAFFEEVVSTLSGILIITSVRWCHISSSLYIVAGIIFLLKNFIVICDMWDRSLILFMASVAYSTFSYPWLVYVVALVLA